jgi:hypothetical protein
MIQTESPGALPADRSNIYKLTPHGEDLVGFVGADGVIYKVRWQSGIAIGRIEENGDEIRLFRTTRHDEKGVGSVDADGVIYSYGLFEGGELGWLDPDGVVVQGGLILGEEEVGRVEGPQDRAAAAALLLIFLPEDAEASRRMTR